RLSRSPSPRSFPAANVQRHQRIELRRLHHHIDFDLFVSCADAPAARADLDGWYPQLVVDVGVGPDAGAVRRFRLDLFAEQVLVDFFCRLDQRLDIFSLVTEERFVDVHLVIKVEFVEGLLQFILDRDRADVRRYAHVDVDGTNAGEVVRSVGRTALDRADINLGKQWASGRIVDVFLFELRSPSLQRVDDPMGVRDISPTTAARITSPLSLMPLFFNALPAIMNAATPPFMLEMPRPCTLLPTMRPLRSA